MANSHRRTGSAMGETASAESNPLVVTGGASEPSRSEALDPSRVAVLLNSNARQVTDALAREMEALVGRDNLFYSRTLEEAEAFAREIVQRGYGTVVCGGGDGTFMRGYNLIARYVAESNAWRQARNRRFGEQQPPLGVPRFAFLGLGTGNGLRRVVGAGSPLRDLRIIVEDCPQREHEVNMVQWGDERFTFGGLGYDSLLLNDYNWLRQNLGQSFLKPVVQTVAGYFGAVFTRTLPRVIAGRLDLEGTIRTNAPAYYVDPRRGDATEVMPAGSVLYQGPLRFTGVGTTPFFGYGLRMFPFAGMRPGMMHLRVTRLGAMRTLASLPSLWRGTFRNREGMFDFLASDIQIELAKPFPFQHSGDDQGEVSRLRFTVAKETLRLVDLYQPCLPRR